MNNKLKTIVAGIASLRSCRKVQVACVGFFLFTGVSIIDSRIPTTLFAAPFDETIGKQMDLRSVKLKVVGDQRFGVPTEFKLVNAVGAKFDKFCESGIILDMLSSGIGVQFRHNRSGKQPETTVVGVYPAVFTEGCVVVVEIDGPLPIN